LAAAAGLPYLGVKSYPGHLPRTEASSMDRLTKQEKKEIYRFLVLVLVVAVMLCIMGLILGLLASKLPVGTGEN
jgi:hypothetical protein